MSKKQIVILLAVVALVALAVDAKNKKKVKAPIVVDEGDPFSDEKHFDEEGHHDAKYDQQAFLGEEQAASMHGLSEKQVKEKLREIFGKIDINQDQKISRKELTEWIVDNTKKHVTANTKSRLTEMDTNKDGKVTWDEYTKADINQVQPDSEEEKRGHADQLQREHKRFKIADSDGDDSLNEDELATFLHPEESPRMASLLVEENVESMDKDGDGMISFKEYVGLTGDEPIDKETHESLKDTFNKELDKNKDGKLDKEEVKNWIIPGGDDDPIVGEAEHLMKEADTDKDNFLSVKEVLQNHELFAGGRATGYGDLLKNEL